MGGLGVSGVLHPAILKAISIDPVQGSTYLDAEHIVLLMQENRSFDHAFGSMKGVRGFADKRAVIKPDGKSVFCQALNGKYAVPTRMDMFRSKSTWMSALPHSWIDQIEAFNEGRYDQWLPAKRSGIKDYKDLPVTMGYYTREDLPFYYQLADAFTIGDHYFCSSLTGTTPNRLFQWSGTLRKEKNGSVKANVYNENIGYRRTHQAEWLSFPEILEKNGISWKIYQNEISLPKGLPDENEAWLSNFTDNPIEWFANYKVKFSPGYYNYLPTLIEKLRAGLEKRPDNQELKAYLADMEKDLEEYKPENFAKLSEFQKSIHRKAFLRNDGDPNFHNIETSTDENGRELTVPAGDVLYEFRKNVREGTLPMVSWIVAPERFSDHPSSPWYGAWYISEVMNILTENPEVWRKTIFIINYDENDGYFDHFVPFTPPNNAEQQVDFNGETGVEFVHPSQKYQQEETLMKKERIYGPVGLGYRVPFIVASPWSRGGYVNSQVFDHTSTLLFLEKFIRRKTGKDVTVDFISHWRRSICGDLTSIFSKSSFDLPSLDYLQQKPLVSKINQAKDKPVPEFRFYGAEEAPQNLQHLQEKGVKKSNALPYFYNVNLSEGGQITMENFGTAGIPLQIFNYKKRDAGFYTSYALYAGGSLKHLIAEDNFETAVHGPNGFYRKFLGRKGSNVHASLDTNQKGEIVLTLKSKDATIFEIVDHYTEKKWTEKISGEKLIRIATPQNSGWYDLSVKSGGAEWHFAGRAESGKESISDPHWI